MDGNSSSEELQRILDAIRSSDVVENRIQLLDKLGELDKLEKCDLVCLLDCLTLWEDYTCLDVSQCLLNKAILSVALKHLESDMPSCQTQFLALGTKASIWCGKHLKMTLMSTDESQEEYHSKLFFQLLLDLLNFSATSYSALAQFPIFVGKLSMSITEKFITEQLNLTKDSISESKRIQSHGPEVIKDAHIVIDAVIRLCGAYSQNVNWNCSDEKLKDKSSLECKGADDMNHVINIIGCTIERLHEIGVVAANKGGSLVSVLNVSWKGVVTLLQLGEGVLATKLSISDIILTLISLVNESLKSTADSWSRSLNEAVSATEARRKFLPIKFYLINAVKISCLYPCQAYTVHSEITLCVLMISAFKHSMSNEKRLKTASEVYTELLEKASIDLLSSLLNSDRVKQISKLEVLECLFISKSVANGDPNDCNEILPLSPQLFDGVRQMLLVRVSLFLCLLRYSTDFEEDVKLWIAQKLGWVLDSLVDEDVYASFLVLRIPVIYGSGKNVELVWTPIFSSLLDSLKMFMVVISSSVVWAGAESFLIENLFHPHFLCREIVTDLWCFVVRHTESAMVVRVIEKLCSLMSSVASCEAALVHGSGIRKLARLISLLLGLPQTQSVVDQVFKSVLDNDGPLSSSVVFLALLMEGFPLNLLSDKMRNIATERILSDYLDFLEIFKEDLVQTCNGGVLGAPIFALSASLESLQISLSDIDLKTLRFLVSIIHSYRDSVDKALKDKYSKLLSETLGIISNMKHLYASDEMEQVIFELENLFISGPEASMNELRRCKPHLALFIAGLAHAKITVSEQRSKFSAACELYHMMLRERHWALVHLAITAFGYFSARTSCDELWRFVPSDAALSYDLPHGDDPKEERFMADFKVFLDKETALGLNSSSSEQIRLLSREGLVLKEMFEKTETLKLDTGLCDRMEIDGEKQQSKKRKLPEGISEGMELLRSGLKVIVNGISQWQKNQPESSELHDEFIAHCSRLEDEITRIVGLAGNN